MLLLVIDVGNTHTVLGVFRRKELIKDWRIRTERNTTEDEFNVLAKSLFNESDIELENIDKILISCVVPPVISILDSFCRKYVGHAPYWVNSESVKNIMPILYNNPEEVGADRIVNAIAAFRKYKTSLIVIDFGTATTFDVISDKGEYLGGAITPGVMISSEALFIRASKLPRVDLFLPPKQVIGKDTLNSIKSGIIFGYASLVDGMVNKIKHEMKSEPKILATGGLSELISKVSDTIEDIDKSLTLEGLRIIGEELA